MKYDSWRADRDLVACCKSGWIKSFRSCGSGPHLCRFPLPKKLLIFIPIKNNEYLSWLYFYVLFRILITEYFSLSVSGLAGWMAGRGWAGNVMLANGWWNSMIFHYARVEAKGRMQLRNDQRGQCWSHPINRACSASPGPGPPPACVGQPPKKIPPPFPQASLSLEESSGAANGTLADVIQTLDLDVKKPSDPPAHPLNQNFSLR